MRLLLDTHVFLWWVDDATELSRRARRVIAAPENECFLSLGSCWELAIKLSLGKLKLRQPIAQFIPEQMAANHFVLLELAFAHVARVAALPFHHRDPFDRLLVAQALEEDLAVVTADAVFAKYGVKRFW
jgi:PIN domain nuclease of toxin-antitoxin system